MNPADRRDTVGQVEDLAPCAAGAVLRAAAAQGADWAAVPPAERAAFLERAADLMEARIGALMGIVMREAGKTAANAVGEVREAVDFLRYYAAEARSGLGPSHGTLGPIVCISPWNFPLAIFTDRSRRPSSPAIR